MATIDQFNCYHKRITRQSFYPVITNIVATVFNRNSVLITWTTDVPSTSQVAFGINQNKDQKSPYDSTYVTSHSVTITGLLFSTVYFYNVQSYNIDSLTISPQNVFITDAPVANYLQLEDGTYILLEDGTRIILEQ